MTQTQPPASAQLGQAVGEAARTLGRLQSGVLRRVGASFETWVALNTIATRRPALDADPIPLDRATLVRELVRGMQHDAAAVEALIANLEADGLIARENGDVELTDAGREVHEKIRAGSAATTERLIEGLDAGLVEQTVLALRELARRGEALLES